MKYVIVFKEGASILKDGKLLEGINKRDIITFWEESESFKVGNYPIIFFQDGTIWDGILKNDIKQRRFWRNDYKPSIKEYVRQRIQNESKV